MLTIYTLADAERWDATVRSFRDYDVYYLSGYARAFQLHGDGEPLLFHYEGESLRGINVVMKRDIALDPHFTGKLEKNTYFDFATPYGYGGWLLEGVGDKSILIAAYEAWCQENGIVSEFVRFHPLVMELEQLRPFYEPIPIRKTVGTNLAAFDDPVQSEFTKGCRKNIRKTMHLGVSFRVTEAPEDISGFQRIYISTMERNRAGDFYYFDSEFFKNIGRGLKKELLYIEAVYEGEAIAAGIDFVANGIISTFLSGTLKEYLFLAPSYVLNYATVLWGKEHGFRLIHQGGGTSNAPDNSLYLFKKQFGRNTEFYFYIARKIFLPETYEWLVSMRGDLPEDSGFFPRYRA